MGYPWGKRKEKGIEFFEDSSSIPDERICMDNTAVFTGDGSTAAFFGQEYTLNFNFHDVTSVNVPGFRPTEGITDSGNGIPGHEFS